MYGLGPKENGHRYGDPLDFELIAFCVVVPSKVRLPQVQHVQATSFYLQNGCEFYWRRRINVSACVFPPQLQSLSHQTGEL